MALFSPPGNIVQNYVVNRDKESSQYGAEVAEFDMSPSNISSVLVPCVDLFLPGGARVLREPLGERVCDREHCVLLSREGVPRGAHATCFTPSLSSIRHIHLLL